MSFFFVGDELDSGYEFRKDSELDYPSLCNIPEFIRNPTSYYTQLISQEDMDPKWTLSTYNDVDLEPRLMPE